VRANSLVIGGYAVETQTLDAEICEKSFLLHNGYLLWLGRSSICMSACYSLVVRETSEDFNYCTLLAKPIDASTPLRIA